MYKSFTKLIAVAILSIFFVKKSGAQTGATLVNTILTEVNAEWGHSHYGMDYSNNHLYLSAYCENKIVKIDLTTGENSPGFPQPMENVDGPHGIAADDEDGSIWECDLNNVMLRHYSPEMELLSSTTVGSQPVNAIIHEGMIYVADRAEDKIYIVNKSTLQIENSFAIQNMIIPNWSDGYLDLVIYNNMLYIVFDQLTGVAKMNLDGTNQEMIMIGDIPQLQGYGICITNNKMYLISGGRYSTNQSIIVANMSGEILNSWPLDDIAGLTSSYIDMEVIDEKIYVASTSYYNGDFNLSHILVYQEGETRIEKIESTDIEISPNPVAGELHIKGMEDGGLAQIYSISGKLIMEFFERVADVSNLPQGTYILKITNRSGEISTNRFVKQ